MITQQPNEYPKTPEQEIADEIFEYSDERVGHAENVSKEKLIYECYHKLGKLLAEWAKKLDEIEITDQEPQWLKKYLLQRESKLGAATSIDSASLGFAVEHLYFAKEKNPKLSDDSLLVSEPHTMLMEDFRSLSIFCEENGLDFYVDGFNRNLPGRTFRLSVYHLKPGSSPLSRTEFREKTMKVLSMFEKMSTGSEGRKIAVERLALEKELVKSGKFDAITAETIVAQLIETGQIPKHLVLG